MASQVRPCETDSPPAAPTQPVSKQAPGWELRFTSSVTWMTSISHLHAISGPFPLATGGSLENCLHLPALTDDDNNSSEDRTVAVLSLLPKKYLHKHPGSPTSELAGTFRKILVQLPHYINKETESQRGKVSKILPRKVGPECGPAESSPPCHIRPTFPEPHNHTPRPTPHPCATSAPLPPSSRWQSLRSRWARL